MRSLIITILILCTTAIYAQTGKVRGVVRDAISGELLSNIEVYISGTNVQTMTNDQGSYSFENAPLGYHKLLFRSLGYADFTSEPALITAAQTRVIDVRLTPYDTKLDAVQVVGRNIKRIETPPVGVHKLNIQEIEKSPGGNRDISKVVQNLPGVVATPINRNDLIVRGGGPNENKFYLDRVEIPVINHFQTQGASGGNASLINSDFLSGATLYTSAFPTSRGNALSAVLDLKMTEGNSEKFKLKFAVGASDLALTIDTPIGEKGSLIASYRVSYLQFLFSMLKMPFLPTYQDAQFKYAYHFDDKNSLSIIGLGSFDKNRLNKNLNDLEPDKQAIIDYIPESDQWSYVVGAVYTHRMDKGALNAIMSTNRLNNVLQKWQNNDPNQGRNLDYRSNEIEAKARIEYDMDLGKGYFLNAGISVDRGFYDNHTTQKTFVDSQPVDKSYSTDLYLTRYSAYAAVDKAFFGNKLRLNLSARVDGNDYTSSMNNPLRQFSPRFALSYAFVPRWSFNANIGRYYEEPSYTTMGYRSNTGELVNRNRLKYMESDQLTVGFAFDPRSGERISIEGFYKGYNRYPMSLIDSTAIGSAGSDVFAVGAEPAGSVGRARAYGFEVMYRNEDLWGFLLNVSYTYYYSQYRALNSHFEPTGRYVASNWDNRHLFNIVTSRSLPHGWDIGARWRFAGGAPTTPYDLIKSSQIDSWQTTHRPVSDYSQVNTRRLPAFHQLDIRVDKTWYFPKWTFSVYVDIQNLYNYKAYGNDILTPETDATGNYIKDPADESRYIMKSFRNEIGGSIIPTFGIIIEI